MDQAARAEHLRPRRALAPVALLPDAGHPRGRHPGHHGRCRRLVRAEDLSHPRGPGHRGGGGGDRWPAGEVDRGPGGEPDQRRARPGGVAADHRRDRRERRAAGRPGPPPRERRRLPERDQRPESGAGLSYLPRAVPLVRARLGGLLRAGALHEHVRDLRLPGAVDDGDHRPGADGRCRRAPAGHRSAGVPPPERHLPRRAALHQRDEDGVRGRQPGRVPGAGGRADRLRAVPQGSGAGPRRGPPARHRAVPVHRAPAGPR